MKLRVISSVAIRLIINKRHFTCLNVPETNCIIYVASMNEKDWLILWNVIRSLKQSIEHFFSLFPFVRVFIDRKMSFYTISKR